MDIYSLPSGAEVLVDFNPYFGSSPTVADEILIKDIFESAGAALARAESWAPDTMLNGSTLIPQLCFCKEMGLYSCTDTAG